MSEYILNCPGPGPSAAPIHLAHKRTRSLVKDVKGGRMLVKYLATVLPCAE